MKMLLLLIVGPGLITAASPMPVSGELHSDLHLPIRDACRTNKPFRFDVFKGSDQIGSYDGELQGLNGYENRLKYSNCTITLTSLTEQDGTEFRVTLYYNVKNTLERHDLNYEVIILDPPTTPYIEEKTLLPADLIAHNVSRNSTDGLLSFVSFCLSLDSMVNALVTLALLIKQRSCNKLRPDAVDSGYPINFIFTIASEFCSSIVILPSGAPYCWLLIPFPIILLVGWILPFVPTVLPVTRFTNRCCFSDDMKSTCMWSIITLLLQLLFAVCAGLLHHRFNGDISRRESPMVGYVFLSVGLSFVWRISVLIGTCCYKSGHKKFTAVPKDETKTAAGNPKGDSETPV